MENVRNEEGKKITDESDILDLCSRYDLTIQSLFFWRPDNIFIGPEKRPNDLGSNFDVEARFIVQHYELSHQFYDTILKFRGESNTSKKEGSLAELYSLHSELAKITDMTPYRPEDWSPASENVMSIGLHIIEWFTQRMKKNEALNEQLHKQDIAKLKKAHTNLEPKLMEFVKTLDDTKNIMKQKIHEQSNEEPQLEDPDFQQLDNKLIL